MSIRTFLATPIFLLPLAAALSAAPAGAATLSVHLAAANGHPVHDAVVLLEPTTTHLPVKPMSVQQVPQRNKQFDPQVLVITVGTPVVFPNFDTVRHHVYSFSPIKSFELKLYAGTPHEPIVFDKPGIATLGCNIHDQMIAWIIVADTPFHAQTGADGTVKFTDVPAGSYRVRAWHPDLPDNAPPVTQAVEVGTADLERRVQLDVKGQ
ncbi:MAG TPA: methylamine utilization protein [Burkholderiaceae bacterium]|nr:methylamine utilization protein [Burkholderiaceae bacterium]